MAVPPDERPAEKVAEAAEQKPAAEAKPAPAKPAAPPVYRRPDNLPELYKKYNDIITAVVMRDQAAASELLDDGKNPNARQSDIAATSWFTRADARPNFGDYNQSAILEGTQYVMLWADGRFLPPGRSTVLRTNTQATPDVLFMKGRGLSP